MSIFSDYSVGALSDDEFRSECARMNREDRWEREHEFDDMAEPTCVSCACFGTDACIRLNTEDNDEICDFYVEVEE